MSQGPRARDQLVSRLEQTVREHMPSPRADLGLPILPTRVDRLLGAVEAIHGWVCEFDSQGRMLYASPQIESTLGFSPEECMASDCIEFHPDDLPVVIATGRKLRETGEPATNQTRLRHKQGHWVWHETTLVGWYDSDQGDFHTVSFARDITQIKLAEAAKRETDERYRIVSESSCDLIFEVDAEARLSYVGPNSEEVVGYTPEETLELEPWARFHPDDVTLVQQQFEEQFGALHGSEEPPSSSGSRTQPMEFRFQHRDGRWLWFETLGLTYVTADGEKRFLGVTRDITESRIAEQTRRRFEENLQRSQRLESLGVLAGGIAHDFNNLLTPILGSAGLGLEELPKDSPVRARLLTIQEAAKRAATLTNQMLTYAGQQSMRVGCLEVSKLVEEIQALLASSVSGKTTFDLRLEHGLPLVEGEVAQLGQVVMNLVANAAESLSDGEGRIDLRTGVVDLDSPPAKALFAETMSPGRHVYFEVSDAGCGMDAETCERIFDPFFTTKFTGRGLGLAAVEGIVRAHRGAIEVESEPGLGTRFRVLLPAIEGRVTQSAPEDAPVDGWRTTGVALVIDDDRGVRELAEDVLRRAGMKVLTASDGHAGVKLFALHADEIRLVLLDRTMPSLSGGDTFAAIRALRADTKIMIFSGYSEQRAIADLSRQGLAGFLKKPFLPEALVARVREVLEGR